MYSDRLIELQQLITETYSAELWQAVKAALAVTASLSLRGRSNPFPLIFEGASGRGKSTVVNMFAPDREETRKYLYRLDSFTPKSFVTHAANIPKEQMQEIDLLPKLKDKLLVTKELAPSFRGKDDALRESFATLTSVLDGKGYCSASGVHGTRGYEEAHIFNWIGGTTPIPPRTDEIMAQLGNRLLRYELIGEEESEEDLLEFALNYDAAPVEDTCRSLTNACVADHFGQFPVNSVGADRFAVSKDAVSQVVRLAKLVARGRVELHFDDKNCEFIPSEPEGPQRVILLLRTYVLGFALLHPECQIDEEALASARHIAFSSIPRNRRQVLRALLTNRGEVNASDLCRVLRVSHPFALKSMRELAATGLATLRPGAGSSGGRLCLSNKWSWLLPDQQFAETKMKVCDGCLLVEA